MKKNSRLLVLASLGFVLAVNIYLRSFPIYFPQLKAQARDTVRQVVQQHAVMEVQKKFPQFYYSARDAIVKSEMKAYYKANKKSLDTQVEGIYRNMKDKFQDDSGQTYLMELDCWHLGRYVENILKYGHPGDEVIGSQQWDMLMLAPSGQFLNWGQFLFYLSASLYKIFSFFKNVPVFTFLFYLPLLFSGAFIVVLYFFAFRLGRHICATLSCLFVGLSPIFLQRSCAGWFDTDTLNLFFPVVITWTYILFVQDAEPRYKFLWLTICSLLVGLFAFTWSYWWFIFLFILLYAAFSLAYNAFIYFYPGRFFNSQEEYLKGLSRKAKFRLLGRSAAYTGIFFLLSLFWVRIIAGGQPLVELWQQLTQTISLNKPLMATIWPNVFSTVGELRKITLQEMSRLMGGGIWVIGLSLLSIVILVVRGFFSRQASQPRQAAAVILVIWAVAMFFATSRGVRFSAFLLVPLAVSLGQAVNEAYDFFRIRNNRKGMAFVIIVAVILCVAPIPKGYAAAKSIYPLMDDTWYKVLNVVKEKSPQDTVINSWWDFGDWFKAVAGRRVIFDGQSQYIPQAHWMAKALLSNDENQAVTILRMLNNGGNRAFDIVNKHIKDPLEAVLLLEYFISLSPEQAKDIMPKFLPSQDASVVMNLLYSPSASAVFAVDHSMPYKLPAVSYLGNWNFSRVYIAKNLNKTEKNKMVEYLKDLKGNEQDIQRWYQEAFLITRNNLDEWLSQRLQVYSPLLNGRITGDVVSFENGFSYNVKDRTLGSGSGQVPRSMFNLVNGQVAETIYPNANVPFSILVYEAKDGYKSILLDRELGGSLFARLYFMEGKGLKHFLPFVDSQEGNNYIRFFVIVW